MRILVTPLIADEGTVIGAVNNPVEAEGLAYTISSLSRKSPSPFQSNHTRNPCDHVLPDCMDKVNPWFTNTDNGLFWKNVVLFGELPLHPVFRLLIST